MSQQGVTATESLMKELGELARGLSADEWELESAAAGWRVQDVIVHLGTFCNLIADPEMTMPENAPPTSERLNDALVDERRHWTAEEAIDYYEAQSTAALAALTALQGPEFAEATIPLADLGTYHLAELSNAFAFDHLVHLTSDLLAPHGPIDREAIDVDTARIAPALDWMLAGLPNMYADALREPLTRPLGFDLTGPGARSFVISWSGDHLVVDDATELPADVAVSSTVDFLRWSTKRSDWRPSVTIVGDSEFVAPVLDTINII
ncbi:maleylpyruvate isomerase N-terminal domain-containing protein [Gordonia rubripertincta]|uniref:Maleylpyruvate isomerase N-terminal domain-containing protein n=1 Tax=Gordonia rubripertincta TaxID=36822 RepID=A0ABT4MZ65_GORRU|nr:maleylpyruvate isomerase N-terminal domain-containing protein [Gordonia rubripertincta]MCZ4552099.1 maleylpyruvate isomerase N-terminal domain-containing protein [Gordonia rubripertincta]